MFKKLFLATTMLTLSSLALFCSAIMPVILGTNEAALNASLALLEAGYLAPAIRFPTVPRGSARLRITLSAEHTAESIEGLHKNLLKSS